MKRNRYKQIRLVQGESTAEAVEKFNRAMADLRDLNPEVERIDSQTFFIYYTLTEVVAETKADKYELRGEEIRCADCPFFEPFLTANGSPDKRMKRGFCLKKNRDVFKSMRADSECYEWIERRGDEERKD